MNKKDNYKYKLKKPIDFEGQNYTELDLSEIENLTGNDLRKIDSQYRRSPDMGTRELSSAFLQIFLAYVTKLPIEFFGVLYIKDALGLEIRTRNFLLV